MNNRDIRTLLKMKRIPMWKVAEQIGISEPTITRWFREPLTTDHFQKVMKAIEEIERTVDNEQNNEDV